MARSIECKCESNFTCGYCLRNAKPWHFTCTPSYSAVAVNRAIEASNRSGQRIGKREAAKIHALLKGWRGDREEENES